MRVIEQQLQQPNIPHPVRVQLLANLERLQSIHKQFSERIIKSSSSGANFNGTDPTQFFGAASNQSAASLTGSNFALDSHGNYQAISGSNKSIVSSKNVVAPTNQQASVFPTPSHSMKSQPGSRKNSPSKSGPVNSAISSNVAEFNRISNTSSQLAHTAIEGGLSRVNSNVVPLNRSTTTAEVLTRTAKRSPTLISAPVLSGKRMLHRVLCTPSISTGGLRESTTSEGAHTSTALANQRRISHIIEDLQQSFDLHAQKSPFNMISGHSLKDLHIVFTSDGEEALLGLADRYLSEACRSICESARHRKRPGIALKDLEMALGYELGAVEVTAALPHAICPSGVSLKLSSSKKTSLDSAVSSSGNSGSLGTSAVGPNPHLTRMQQLRKHLSTL